MSKEESDKRCSHKGQGTDYIVSFWAIKRTSAFILSIMKRYVPLSRKWHNMTSIMTIHGQWEIKSGFREILEGRSGPDNDPWLRLWQKYRSKGE